jgi:hypothetical protein
MDPRPCCKVDHEAAGRLIAALDLLPFRCATAASALVVDSRTDATAGGGYRARSPRVKC